MPIKQPQVLSRADFDEAVVRLRINVSEIAKATAIPRTYLSEFRNGDRTLRPEHQAKLRDFFEGKGIEFDPPEAGGGAEVPEGDPARGPHPSLTAVRGVKCYFQIPDRVDDERVKRGAEGVEDAKFELLKLLKEPVQRERSFVSSPDYTDEFKGKLQQAFGIAAFGFVSFLMATGGVDIDPPPENEDDPKTMRDVFYKTFKAQLIAAGLIEAATEEEVEE
jgi:hypothetical protein